MGYFVELEKTAGASWAVECGTLRQARAVVATYKHDPIIRKLTVVDSDGSLLMTMRGAWISSRGTSFEPGTFRVLVNADTTIDCATLRECNDVVHSYKHRPHVHLIEVVDVSKRSFDDRLLAHYGSEWLRGA